MNKESQRELIEIVLYILNKTGGLDYYHVFKILYFAQKDYLSQWGHRLIQDDFCALENGPVPTNLYDAVKGQEPLKSKGLLSMFNEAIRHAGEDAPHFLIALRNANLDYLSEAAINALDKAIHEYSNMSFGHLKDLSHDAAWAEAWGHPGGSRKMDIVSIAKASTDNKAMIEYITDNELLESALS
ncbi:MAG: SocA family protein [Bacteroidales bacterium]|nr:SocA family protein [Bacteroidales bacterium]